MGAAIGMNPLSIDEVIEKVGLTQQKKIKDRSFDYNGQCSYSRRIPKRYIHTR